MLQAVTTAPAPQPPAADAAGPALFTHAPRRPNIGFDEFSNQRRFGASEWESYRGVACVGSESASASVYRSAVLDYAELRVGVGFVPRGASAEVRLALDADRLRELARCLIDAAHDLEAHPAPVAEQVTL